MKRNSNKKKPGQSNFAKLSIFQPQKYKFKKKCPLSGKGAPIIDYKNVSKTISNLNSSLSGTHNLVVDVSDARSVFSLNGGAVRDVLSKGSPADLSVDALPIGEVRRTRIAQLAVAFWFTDELNCQLICFRSVGGYIMEWLKNASEDGSEVNFH